MASQLRLHNSEKIYITTRHRPLVRPLPLPKIGSLSGVSCPVCPITSTAQLVYQRPNHPNHENISWKCHEPISNHNDGKNYIRTLKVNKLVEEIHAVNVNGPPLPAHLAQHDNIGNVMPDLIRNQAKLCPGFAGKTGATHHASTHINKKCKHQLCLSCCQMGQLSGQLVCNFKGHRRPTVALSQPMAFQTNPDIASFMPHSNSLPTSTSIYPTQSSSTQIVQSAQANRAVTATLTPSQLKEYHSNLQSVALARKKRQEANFKELHTVWIELWTTGGSSVLIHADAPDWPAFSLQESQVLIDKCRRVLGERKDWESEILVWNMTQFRWMCLASTAKTSYPLIPRKLLVRLDQVPVNDCAGLSDAILQMTTDGPYEPLTTPARCVLGSTKTSIPTVISSSNVHSLTSSISHSQGTLSVTSKSCSPLPSPSQMFSNVSERCSSPTHIANLVINQKSKSKKTWPDHGVLLSQTISWYKSFQGKGSPRDSWNEFFGNIYDYGHSTVYYIRKWIFLVGLERLEESIDNQPFLTLIES